VNREVVKSDADAAAGCREGERQLPCRHRLLPLPFTRSSDFVIILSVTIATMLTSRRLFAAALAHSPLTFFASVQYRRKGKEKDEERETAA